MLFKQNELGMAGEWGLGRVNVVTREESTAREDDEDMAVALKWGLLSPHPQKATVHSSIQNMHFGSQAAGVGISALSLTGCVALGISWSP